MGMGVRVSVRLREAHEALEEPDRRACLVRARVDVRVRVRARARVKGWGEG